MLHHLQHSDHLPNRICRVFNLRRTANPGMERDWKHEVAKQNLSKYPTQITKSKRKQNNFDLLIYNTPHNASQLWNMKLNDESAHKPQSTTTTAHKPQQPRRQLANHNNQPSSHNSTTNTAQYLNNQDDSSQTLTIKTTTHKPQTTKQQLTNLNSQVDSSHT